MGEWLKENRITTTSYPFVTAVLGLVGDDEVNHYTLTSDFGKSQSDVAAWASITGAQIEGYVPYGRKGSVSLVDPSGAWASHLTEVGMQSNAYYGGIGPNLEITFGWRGLRFPDRDGDEVSATVTGYITKVEQDISNEGIFSATINYVEFSEVQLGLIKFLEKEDMFKGLPKNLWETVGSDKAHQEYLNYVMRFTGDDSDFSVTRMLHNKNIEICFLDADMTEAAKEKRYPRVRFGDPLEQYITDVIAQMQPLEEERDAAEEENMILSYEKAVCDGDHIPPDIESEIESMCRNGRTDDEWRRTTIVYYQWVRTPDGTTETEVADVRDHLEPGPPLIWKFNGEESITAFNGETIDGDNKVIVGWQSDLSSHTHLIHQFQDQLSDRLAGFSESDWDNLLDHIENSGGVDEAESIEWWKNEDKIRNAAETGGDIRRGLRDDVTRYQMFEAMDEVSEAERKYDAQQSSDALRAVIMNNAFKATATIMGDPTLGTRYEGARTRCITHFDEDADSSTSSLAGVLFNREWMMLKTTHKFEEGKYTTDIELLGYPDPVLTPEEELARDYAEYADAMREAGISNLSGTPAG